MPDKVFGIDLGTTNSLIAHVIDREAIVIGDPDTGEVRLPSVVHMSSDGSVLVGAEARALESEDASRTVASVKRFMGIGMERVTGADRRQYQFTEATDGIVKFSVNGKEVTPPILASEILKELKHRAETVTGDKCHKVVITVPAYFDDSQRQATRDAGRLAGLEVLRLVNEPTAAALAYGLDKTDVNETVAVYDFGGGTFDISILRLQEGVFRVLSTNGDTRLGGDDIDRRIADHILELAQAHWNRPDLADSRNLMAQVRHEAERVKISLSAALSAEFQLSIPSENLSFEGVLTRDWLESIIADIVEKTAEPCHRALKDADISLDTIDHVILVGGSTRMPLVKRIVAEIFEKEPTTDLNPDEVVALGASVQADILSGHRRDMLLLDVVPLSLGIETMGGVFTRLIHRNTTIPASITETFTTPADNVTSFDFHVLQGERELVSDNRSLARFQLKGIAPRPAGASRVDVTFLIDANGILSVTAIDKDTGHEHTVEVKPSYGLTDEEIESMLMDSMDHAEEDVSLRLLIDTRVEAKDTLIKTRRVLEGDEAEITESERAELTAAASVLEKAVAGDDREAIISASDTLDLATEPLAERLMTRDIKKWLVKKSVSDLVES